MRSLVCKMGKEFLGADFSLTRCNAARCERGWDGLTRIVLSFFWMGRRHIGAMRLVATRMVPDANRPQGMTSDYRQYIYIQTYQSATSVSKRNAQPSASIKALSAEMHPSPSAFKPAHYAKRSALIHSIRGAVA